MQFNNIFSIVFLSFLFLSIIVKIFLDLINYRHRKRNLKTIPPELNGMVDEKKLLLINQYSNEKLIFSLIGYFFDKIVLLLILFLGIFPLYYNFLTNYFSNVYFLTLLFFGGFYLFELILGLPFSLYFNFVIEKKYQFNKMTLPIWISDLIKRIIISAVIGVILLVPLIFFVYKFENIWWIMIWGFMLAFSLIMQVLYPMVIAPLFNKFMPLENESLRKKIEKLLFDSGLKPGGIFEMDASKRSSHSNAYFTGLGKSKRIVLFDSLLKNHSEDEILSILAHEIGHFKHKHVLKGIIYSSLISLASLFIAYLLIDNEYLYSAFNFSGKIDLNSLKIVGLFLLTIVSSPISFLSSPIGSAMSRRHEYQADEYAVKMIGKSDYLVESLKRLNVDNLSNIFPADVYVWFYYSHPPLFKRIRALEAVKV